MNLVNPNNEGKEAGFNPDVDNTERSAKLSTGAKVVWIILWILIIPLIYHVVKSNWFNRQQMSINNASSSIDTYLKNRKDTLTKLVDATKSYVNYEGETLKAITSLRNMNISRNNYGDADAMINSAFGRLMAVAENYPQLKAESMFQQMMEQATYIEKELAAARRNYNMNVTQYNNQLYSWPASVVAGFKNLMQLPLFAASATDKQDVSLSI
ncbi:LemA family protein [Mycoplasmopsis agassizii]|uniref:LemA family protein n=1 Tax=Mycoplasmopsis agassizii TaxID=33922 RepID=UPI0035298504